MRFKIFVTKIGPTEKIGGVEINQLSANDGNKVIRGNERYACGC